MEERKKKVLIPILLEDLKSLNLNELEFDQSHLAVLQQYLRTHTYLDATNYKYNIEKLRMRIIFELPALPLSKMLIIRQNEDNNNVNGLPLNDNDEIPLLRAEVNDAMAEPAP